MLVQTTNAITIEQQRWADAVNCFLNSEMGHDWWDLMMNGSEDERPEIMKIMLYTRGWAIVENKLAALADSWAEIKRLGLAGRSEFTMSDDEWLRAIGTR